MNKGTHHSCVQNLETFVALKCQSASKKLTKIWCAHRTESMIHMMWTPQALTLEKVQRRQPHGRSGAIHSLHYCDCGYELYMCLNKKKSTRV